MKMMLREIFGRAINVGDVIYDEFIDQQKHLGPEPHPSGSEQRVHGNRKEPPGTEDLTDLFRKRTGIVDSMRVVTHRNPTSSQLSKLWRNTESEELRGLITPEGNAWWWDAEVGTHAGMARLLGLDYDELRDYGVNTEVGRWYINGEDDIDVYARLFENKERQKKHLGPEAHPSGSEQLVHGGGSSRSHVPEMERLLEAWGASSMDELLTRSQSHLGRLFGEPEIAEPLPEELLPVEERGRRRPGECFESAAQYMLATADLDYPRLVHGVIHKADGTAIAHAWVELGDKIFDGSHQQFYETDSYYEFVDAQPEATYTFTEAATQMLKHGHYGYWHENAGGTILDPEGVLE